MQKKPKILVAVLISLATTILISAGIVIFYLFKKDHRPVTETTQTKIIETPEEEPADTNPNKQTSDEQITSSEFKIDIKNYDIEIDGDEITATLNKNPDFIPVAVKFKSKNEILFLADEQNIVADLTDSYLLELVKKGATLADDSKALYDFSKKQFSALNIEEFDYDGKMAASSESNPVKLSDMAKAKVGYCIEQSIFRVLVYAYAGNPAKMVVMYPSQENTEDFGHATVKSLSQTPEDIIQDFIDSGIYNWEIRYFEEIFIEKN